MPRSMPTASYLASVLQVGDAPGCAVDLDRGASQGGTGERGDARLAARVCRS
jgi:hypothetical protein